MMFRHYSKYLFVLLLLVLAAPNSKAETTDQQIKVTLRAIGHAFLLEIDDSTSRILPIEKVGERYVIKFEKEFSFEPNTLFFATFKTLEESNIRDSYIVEVEKCGSNEVIHSFKASLSGNENMLPCQQRKLPIDCYTFYFTEVDKNENILTNQTTTNWNVLVISFILILILIVSVFLYLKKRKSTKKQDPNLISIGQFQFDQKGMKLTLKAQSIELSSKETDLLGLLLANENETLEREYILKVVWGDEGDYVGRTLDVFISKLRKKLEADSSLKIINIRGVGYRFVIN